IDCGDLSRAGARYKSLAALGQDRDVLGLLAHLDGGAHSESRGLDDGNRTVGAVAYHHQLAVGRNARQPRRTADPNIGYDFVVLEVNHRHVGRPRVRHITPGAIGRNIDEVWFALHANRSNHLVSFGVDDADIVRPGVDDVNFVLPGVDRDSRRAAAHSNGFDDVKTRQRSRSQVDHTDRIAFAVGNVGVFAVEGTVIRQGARAKVPPPESPGDTENDNEYE